MLSPHKLALPVEVKPSHSVSAAGAPETENPRDPGGSCVCDGSWGPAGEEGRF